MGSLGKSWDLFHEGTDVYSLSQHFLGQSHSTSNPQWAIENTCMFVHMHVGICTHIHAHMHTEIAWKGIFVQPCWMELPPWLPWARHPCLTRCHWAWDAVESISAFLSSGLSIPLPSFQSGFLVVTSSHFSPFQSCTDGQSLCHMPVPSMQKLLGKKVLSCFYKVEKTHTAKGHAKEQSEWAKEF